LGIERFEKVVKVISVGFDGRSLHYCQRSAAWRLWRHLKNVSRREALLLIVAQQLNEFRHPP
jgi:hypothetical protein